MSTEKQNILSKIRKLMALADSQEPHEAALALRRVKELQEKYSISISDVEVSNIDETHIELSTINPPDYMAHLISVIGKLFNVSPVLSIKRNDKGKKVAIIRFIGYAPNDEIASYCFEVVAKQLKNARKAYMKSLKGFKGKPKTRRADLFCLGFAIALGEKIAPLVPDTNPHQSLIEQYVRENVGGKLKKSRGRSTGKRFAQNEWDAYEKGVEQGKKAQIHRATNGREESRYLNA